MLIVSAVLNKTENNLRLNRDEDNSSISLPKK